MTAPSAARFVKAPAAPAAAHLTLGTRGGGDATGGATAFNCRLTLPLDFVETDGIDRGTDCSWHRDFSRGHGRSCENLICGISAGERQAPNMPFKPAQPPAPAPV